MERHTYFCVHRKGKDRIIFVSIKTECSIEIMGNGNPLVCIPCNFPGKKPKFTLACSNN